jgi:hypothetical protein
MPSFRHELGRSFVMKRFPPAVSLVCHFVCVSTRDKQEAVVVTLFLDLSNVTFSYCPIFRDS